ncbi:uncharacterized protein MELLADRAFT_70917 [Melampsora larici-populina 98AG31]|uniref:WHIM2 domain-containing protein n=1 Tax=Melampsora larici-populina (strain 98AG31 / pathotype 3-4-7) TaxID=747676 RepID=F4R9I0_MELLP|nr:uncharacterized protein MELLADRAFT_70917 [Melampsora larici-populina 98AG31]EGG10986.1 hypothetical protein MELLADRAFT_70917 [Melampsora larici-populina 98AG31]
MNTLLNSKSIKAPKLLMKKQGHQELKDPKEKYEVELFRLNLKEIYLNERFRKFNGVMKTKPIGMDRYFCKYWWFDGIGGNSNCVGQLFVSGPSIDEMDWVLNKLHHHRFHHHHHYCQSDENGNEKQIGIGLGVGGWAVYDTEVQIQGLLNWLNPKGNRESVLRMNLKDWKEYIFEKIKSRCDESNDQKHEGNDGKNGEDHEDRMEIQTDSSLSSQEDEPEEPEEEEIEYNQSSSDDGDDQSSESESDSSSESDD